MFELQRGARARSIQKSSLRRAGDTEQGGQSPLALPLQRLLSTPARAQGQAARPVLRALALQRQEEARLLGAREVVQRQVAALGGTPGVQREVRAPVPARPVTPSDWVTVMRHRAEGVDGLRLDARAFGEFQALQRQVAQSLSQGFRSDRGEPAARYATYGEHLATLQRHALSAPVSRVVLGMIPPAERLPLQRATDEALHRMQVQEQAALNVDTHAGLQRQMAELDAEATRPVLQRIQARRGAGNPLPEAIQRHLEQGLNHDLSRVRIHDDAEADKLAKGVNALAFTTGTDIFFQSGRFDPNTRSGLELLAHEVTHTVQQSQGRVGHGIDPDAGLESEARDMGARLAQSGPQFGTRHTPRPRAPLLPTAPHTPTVQRWGLGDLKKLAGSAAANLKRAVNTVQNAAQQRIQKTVARVRKAAGPALNRVRQVTRQVAARARQLTATVQARVQSAGKTVREYGRQTLARVQAQARQAAAAARVQAARLHQRAHHLTQQAARTVSKVKISVGHAAQRAVSAIGAQARTAGVRLKRAAQTAGATFRSTANSLLDRARSAGTDLLNRAQATGQRALAATQRMGQQVSAALQRGWQQARKTAAQGWNTAASGLRNLKNQVVSTYHTIKDSPRFKAAVRFLKASGVQILKVGAAIVVGGVVIAGAAALTAATGGLAGPALVAALFASGALGGAASTVVGNLFEKNKSGSAKKWNDGISAKSLITDGVLGVALGPAAKLVGGVARAVGRPVLSAAGRLTSPAARALGRVAGRSPLAQQAGRLLGTGGSRAAQALRGLGGRAAAGWRAVQTRLAPGLARLSGSRAARLLGAADGVFSRGVRGASRGLNRVGEWGGRGVKRLADWGGQQLAARPGLRRALNTPGRWMGRLQDRATILGHRLSSATGNGWRAARLRAISLEDGARSRLSAAGFHVDPSTSFTGRAFSMAERSLTAMRTYASAEARVIGGEVRAALLGSAGSGGVLRTGQEMEKLVASHPNLRADWLRELGRARGALVGARARALRLEAQAAGRALSRQEAKRLAGTGISQDAVYEQALRGVRGPFLSRASAAYQAQSRLTQTGIDPSKNILGQLPRLYRTGTRQMWNDVRERAGQLRGAGGMAGAGAVAGGWISEEVFKTFLGGSADAYKKDDRAALPTAQHLQAGAQKVKSDLPKNVVTATTGLIPEAQGGRLLLGAPVDRVVKTAAAVGGYTAPTNTYELSAPDEEQWQDSAQKVPSP